MKTDMDPTTLVALVAGIPGIGPYLAYLPILVVACAVLDAALPQPAAGSPWVGLRRLIGIIGVNVGAAANLVRPGAIPAGVAARAAEVRATAGAVEQTAGALATAAGQAADALGSPPAQAPTPDHGLPQADVSRASSGRTP